MKVAVLVCDTPAQEIVSQFGNYFQLFATLLSHPSLTFSSFDVTKEEYPQAAADYDAYLLTGSKYSAYEDLAWIKKLKQFVRTLDSTANVKAIQEMHQDHVTVLPPGFDVWASTEKSPVQMMAKGGKYWAVQGHPEYSAGFVQALIAMRLASGVFSSGFVATLADVSLPLDTEVFVKSIFTFLGLQ
ncbi:hypothetical protein HDU91_001900 [Kappamyces sp. JEL0680]|nr:hypothetical protein HDU91_001900 [Kappamyces sp. JEL0680]